MARYLFIILLIASGCNTQKMENQNCNSQKNFNKVKAFVLKNGAEIALSERLIADKSTISKEVVLENNYIELIDNKIIVVKKDNSVPPYFCQINNGETTLSPYEGRFDSTNDIDIRKKDWCNTVKAISELN